MVDRASDAPRGLGRGPDRQRAKSHGSYQTDPQSYHRKLARILDRMGGLYTLNDILSAVAKNEMQSWAEGDSWALTRIALYPRAKVVEVLAVVGNMTEARVLHDRLLVFASEVGANVIQAYGRAGWFEDAKRRGWKIKAKNYVYQREVE